MGLERYVKLTTAAKLCGMDKRTLLSRLEKMGYVVPSSQRHRPIMVREVDVHAVMKNCAVLPSWLVGPNNPAPENRELD